MEELCNIKYRPTATVEVRFKYDELANQFNKADLIRLAKGRLVTYNNLSCYQKFGDNNTKTSNVTLDFIDLVDSSHNSDICTSGSNHQNLCRPVHKEMLSISSNS